MTSLNLLVVPAIKMQTHAEQLKIAESSLGERVLRSEHRVPLATPFPLPEQRKRKQLTAEQLEERWRKVGSSMYNYG